MPNYRRADIKDGMFFFAVALADRLLASDWGGDFKDIAGAFGE